MESVRFVVIGLGGYGLVHIEAVRWLAQQGLGKLTGVVALEADRRARPELAARLESEGVALYESAEQFLDGGVHTADVLTVPVGIHLHVPLSVAAMEAGLHVYCEKPVAATPAEVDRLIDAETRTHRLAAVGYQHIHSRSMQRLKQLVVEGRLGSVRSISLMCGWPRSRRYFTRNEWAGRIRRGDDWILDSPANNAHAHYVLNALYLSSPRVHHASTPARLRAELFRAYPIESCDTVHIRLATPDNVKISILLTHANGFANGPEMVIRGDRGTAYWQTDEGLSAVRLADGSTEWLDNRIHAQWRFEPFRNLVLALRGEAEILCPPRLARAQTRTVAMMHQSCPAIRTVPEDWVLEQEDWEMFPPDTRGVFRRIRDLDTTIHVAIHEDGFLSELGVPWAQGIGAREITDHEAAG